MIRPNACEAIIELEEYDWEVVVELMASPVELDVDDAGVVFEIDDEPTEEELPPPLPDAFGPPPLPGEAASALPTGPPPLPSS